jgi:hypothetical protein
VNPTLEEQNIPFDYTVYDTVTCGHSMHQPCFPYFLEEVNKTPEFFQIQMYCTEATIIQTPLEKPSPRNIIILVNQTTLPWNFIDEKIDLFALDGKLIMKIKVSNGQLNLPTLNPGIYLIRSDTSFPTRLLVN